MSKRGADDDERLLGRLREAASGEQTTKQLKRRYDSLRRDYELLLDRLADIEHRMEAPEPAEAPDVVPPQSAPRPPRATAPPPPPAPGGSAGTGRLTDTLMAPLIQLREEYLAAATSINAIVGGLDSLAAGAMKGQRRAAAPEERPAPVREDAAVRRRSVQVDVKGEGFGNLLDFQERLSELEGVTRVSINAIDNDRATLVVELSDGGAE